MQALYGTIVIPSLHPSVIWSTATPVEDGTLLNMWHHSHSLSGMDEFWLVDGTPNQLGLERGRLRLPRCSRPFVPAESGTTMEAVRQTIVDAIRLGRLRFRCIWTPNAEMVEPRQAGDGVIRGLYTRQSHARCFDGAQRLVAGAPMTQVAFFAPERSMPGWNAAGIQQHAHWQGYAFFASNRSERQTYLATQHGAVGPHAGVGDVASYFSSPEICPWEVQGRPLMQAAAMVVALAHVAAVALRECLVQQTALSVVAVAFLTCCCTACCPWCCHLRTRCPIVSRPYPRDPNHLL